MQQFATDHSVSETPAIPPEGLTQMVNDLFTSMLDMPLNVQEVPAKLPDESFQASVRIRGAWQAKLQVVASKEFASLAACAMFALERTEIQEEQVLDALGEIANVIGGNAKGFVNKDCDLSLPSVGAHEPEQSGVKRIGLSFQYLGEPCQVILQEN